MFPFVSLIVTTISLVGQFKKTVGRWSLEVLKWNRGIVLDVPVSETHELFYLFYIQVHLLGG